MISKQTRLTRKKKPSRLHSLPRGRDAGRWIEEDGGWRIELKKLTFYPLSSLTFLSSILYPLFLCPHSRFERMYDFRRSFSTIGWSFSFMRSRNASGERFKMNAHSTLVIGTSQRKVAGSLPMTRCSARS